MKDWIILICSSCGSWCHLDMNFKYAWESARRDRETGYLYCRKCRAKL